MQHPEKFSHEDEEYDLSHLNPRSFNLTIDAKGKHSEVNFTLDVKFTNHCYSEGTPLEEGETHNLLDHNGKRRWFCPKRHASSLQLPELMLSLTNKRCLFTAHHNWLIIESQGESDPFYIYFSLKKHRSEKNTLVMYIESAFVKDRGKNEPRRRRKSQRTSFAILARKTLKGESVRRPLK